MFLTVLCAIGLAWQDAWLWFAAIVPIALVAFLGMVRSLTRPPVRPFDWSSALTSLSLATIISGWLSLPVLWNEAGVVGRNRQARVHGMVINGQEWEFV